MTFRIGQKVECISDNWTTELAIVMPVRKKIYIVRDVTRKPWSDPQMGLHLEGLVNSEFGFNDGCYEPYFDARYFRPIVDRKTDISVLTALLNPANHNEFVE